MVMLHGDPVRVSWMASWKDKNDLLSRRRIFGFVLIFIAKIKYINCERDGEVISEIINLTFIRKGGLAKAENTSLFFSKKSRRSFVHRVT